MDLEEIVSKVSDKFEVSPKYRQVGLELVTDRLGWLARHKEVYQTLTEQAVEDELQYFYRMRGAIPIITAEGPKRILAVSDLYLLRPFEIGVVKKERRYDPELFRLDRRISERDRRENGPSRGELIDQLGQTQQLRSHFHRPISYDDVLPVWEVMRRYQTGQRAITIRIGEKQVAMIPETVDDLWVLNTSFIKLRINGALVNERLYYFWRRVESDGRSNGRDSGKDSSEPPWHTLINHEGRQKGVVAYLGTAATWESVASNLKAKFIKNGPLPSSELVRFGVLTAMPRRKAKAKSDEEAASKGETRTDHKPKYTPRHASWEEFRGYVPASQLAEAIFKNRLREEIHQKGAPNIARAVQLAEGTGLETMQGKSVEDRVRGIVRGSEEYTILARPGSDPKNPDEYIGLKKFLGEKGEGIRNVLYSALEQAVKEINPDYNLRAAHQLAGWVVTVLQQSDIETKGDLEELLQKGWGAIQTVKRLVNEEPSKAYRLACLLRACQIVGYEVPPEAVAASPLKYRGKDSKPVKEAFRPHIEQAISEANPHFSKRAVNQVTGGLIYGILENNGIVFMSDLEELLKKGKDAIVGLKGLVSKDPSRKHAYYDYFVKACEVAGYNIGNGAAAAAISAPTPSAQAAS